MVDRYLIWSNEHKMWWRPKSAGYTSKPEEAGRYYWEEAKSICTQANIWQTAAGAPPDEVPVLDCDLWSGTRSEVRDHVKRILERAMNDESLFRAN